MYSWKYETRVGLERWGIHVLLEEQDEGGVREVLSDRLSHACILVQ